MPFSPKYRSKIHEALLVQVVSDVGTETGYELLDDRQLEEIVSSKDLATVKEKNYHQAFVLKTVALDVSNNPDESPREHQVYVKLGLFLAILNRQLKKADTPYFSFALSVGDNKYRTIDGHISIDPSICLIPSTLDGIVDSNDTGVTSPLVYDLWLNVDFITRILDQHIDRFAGVALLDMFESMFNEVERVTGVINKYELQYYEETSLFSVVDRNYLKPEPSKNFPEISIFGLDSIVRNLNLVTKISSKLSSMVAIAAQDSPFTSNTESTGFNALNADLEQGISNSIEDESIALASAKLTSQQATYEEVLEDFKESMQGLIKHLNAIYKLHTLSLTDANIAAGAYQNYCNMLIGKKNDPSYSFIIPFELSLTLHGISGVRVLESFKINKNILPATYGGSRNVNVAFVITGVEHQVNRTGWITNLKTQIYNVNDKGTVNNGKDYSFYWPLTALKVSGETGSGGSGGGATGDRYKGTTQRSLTETTAFVTDVLKGIGISNPNSYQVKFMEAWRQKEGAQAAWNPFNTTLKVQDSLRYNIISETIGVQNYPNRQAGLDATIKTLNSRYYTDLVTAIKAIKDDATANTALQALHNSPWGTKFNPFPSAANVSKLKLTDPIWGDPIIKR